MFSKICKPVTNCLFSLELAILGCNVSADSIKAARHLFEEIRPKLNLPNLTVAAENFKPLEVKHYLMKNHLKFCMLVVDATTVKDARGNQERKQEYEDLLKTAAHEVGKFEFFISI